MSPGAHILKVGSSYTEGWLGAVWGVAENLKTQGPAGKSRSQSAFSCVLLPWPRNNEAADHGLKTV